MKGGALDRLANVYARAFAAGKMAGDNDLIAARSAQYACDDFIEFVRELREDER